MARVGQRHAGVGQQGVVTVVDDARQTRAGVVILAQHNSRADGRVLPISQRLQHPVKVGLIKLRVGARIDHPRGGKQANRPAGGVVGEHLLARRSKIRVIVGTEIAGARGEEGEVVGVAQRQNRSIGYNLLIGPAFRTTVAQVVYNQRALLDGLVDGLVALRRALPGGHNQLRV